MRHFLFGVLILGALGFTGFLAQLPLREELASRPVLHEFVLLEGCSTEPARRLVRIEDAMDQTCRSASFVQKDGGVSEQNPITLGFDDLQ